MKTILFFFSIMFTLSCSYATSVSNTQTKAPVQKNEATNNDKEILAFLITLDNNEITAAKLALSKPINKNVKEYAQFMINEHSKNLQETQAVGKAHNITPMNNGMVNSLKKNGKHEVVVLMPLTAVKFEKAYMNGMVKGHREALVIINGSLLKQVQNPALKKLLIATRKHVMHHLNVAKSIQKSLGA